MTPLLIDMTDMHCLGDQVIPETLELDSRHYPPGVVFAFRFAHSGRQVEILQAIGRDTGRRTTRFQLHGRTESGTQTPENLPKTQNGPHPGAVK
jgi:hypothetical protein